MKSNSGQSLVETLMVIPIFFVFLVGILKIYKDEEKKNTRDSIDFKYALFRFLFF